jgi:hypothetical protein
LDYLGDGVVNFTCTEYNRRRIREMEIIKLRGCEIQQPKFIFTLDGGRIQSFGYHRNQATAAPKGAWRPMPDLNGRVSCGLVDLDRALNGGLEKGSINLIELGQGVPTTVSNDLESALVSNFVSLGRGVMWVPRRKASAETPGPRRPLRSREQLDKTGQDPGKATDDRGRIRCSRRGTNAFLDFKWHNIVYSLNGSQRPILTLMASTPCRRSMGATSATS